MSINLQMPADLIAIAVIGVVGLGQCAYDYYRYRKYIGELKTREIDIMAKDSKHEGLCLSQEEVRDLLEKIATSHQEFKEIANELITGRNYMFYKDGEAHNIGFLYRPIYPFSNTLRDFAGILPKPDSNLRVYFEGASAYKILAVMRILEIQNKSGCRFLPEKLNKAIEKMKEKTQTEIEL